MLSKAEKLQKNSLAKLKLMFILLNEGTPKKRAKTVFKVNRLNHLCSFDGNDFNKKSMKKLLSPILYSQWVCEMKTLPNFFLL